MPSAQAKRGEGCPIDPSGHFSTGLPNARAQCLRIGSHRARTGPNDGGLPARSTGAYRPVLAENSALCCFPGARTTENSTLCCFPGARTTENSPLESIPGVRCHIGEAWAGGATPPLQFLLPGHENEIRNRPHFSLCRFPGVRCHCGGVPYRPRCARPLLHGPAGPNSLKTLHWRVFRAFVATAVGKHRMCRPLFLIPIP